MNSNSVTPYVIRDCLICYIGIIDHNIIHMYCYDCNIKVDSAYVIIYSLSVQNWVKYKI